MNRPPLVSPVNRAFGYALAVPATAVAIWGSVAMPPINAAPLATTALSLVVALSAWCGGIGPGVFALVISSVALDFFIIEPGTFFRFAALDQFVAFLTFIGGWLLFCWLVDGVFKEARRDRYRRVMAERGFTQATRLAQLAGAFAQARTPSSVIEAAVQESLHALKADAAALFLVSADGEQAEPARVVAYPVGLAPSTRALADSSPLSDAVNRGAPVIIESKQASAEHYPAGAGAGSAFAATVALPLVIGGRTQAVVQLDFEAPRTLTAEDREYLRALGTFAARALDRAWQLEHAEQARSESEKLRAHADQELAERKAAERALRASETRYRALAARTGRLHALSAALSEAVTTQAVARAVVTHGRPVVGATAGEVILLVDNGSRFEVLYEEPRGLTNHDLVRFSVEKGWCSTHAVQAREGVFIRNFAEWQERYWRSASAAADGGYESSATMPLLVEGSPIGVLAFHFTMPVNFDNDYQALLMSVARYCAQALDRARLYESTQRARAEAEDANRIKDEFVSIVSHELRTPLNAILGWTTMLQRGSLDREKSARALQSIGDNASRQARLIEDLLDFSRVAGGRTALQVERLDMRAFIRGVVDAMSPTALGRGVELRLAPVPAVEVRGDVRRLEQVFFNIIENALKFTPPEGVVSLDARVVDGHVEVRVQDTGIGIEPEFLPLVFDRFRQGDSTTTRGYGGLGLGLAIAKQLVEAHKGSIWAGSGGKGTGATFTVRLPATPLPADASVAAPRPPEPASDEAPRLDGVRVLVVDDEVDAREIMAHALETCGASVSVAASARDARGILEQEPVDVLLSDIAMPGEDGFSLIRWVRSSSTAKVASMPAAAVTSFTRDEHRQHALDAGFQLHLAKPLGAAELARAVETLAGRAMQM